MMGRTVMPAQYKISDVGVTLQSNNKRKRVDGTTNKTTYEYINNGFSVIRNAIPKEIIEFALDTWKTMETQPNFQHTFESEDFITTKHVPDGSRNKSKGNHNTPMGVAMQQYIWNILKKEFDFDLLPTYSYTRKYERGAYLGVHSDRPECEVSTTICLDYKTDNKKPWKIWVDNSKNWTLTEWNEDAKALTQGIPIRKRKSISVDLEPGALLLYQGPNVAHWRDTLMGDYSYHMFVHFYMIRGFVGSIVGDDMKYDWNDNKYNSSDQASNEKKLKRDKFRKEWSLTKTVHSENNFERWETEKIENDSI
jgi:hypothetical protein